jgi:hypothetical protein
MFNQHCLRILDTLPDRVVRTFLRLMDNYDLRCFRIIQLAHASQILKLDRQRAKEHLESLVVAGVLEVMPGKSYLLLHRLRDECRLSQHHLQEWCRNTDAYRERLNLARPRPDYSMIPDDPRERAAWLLGGRRSRH